MSWVIQSVLLLAAFSTPDTSVAPSPDDYAQQVKEYNRQVAEDRASERAQADAYAEQLKEYDRRTAEQRAFYEKFQGGKFWDFPTLLFVFLIVFLAYSQISARRRSAALIKKQKEDVERFGRQYDRMIELLESINNSVGKGSG